MRRLATQGIHRGGHSRDRAGPPWRAAAVAVLMIGADPVRALECPMPQPATTASAIRETAPEIAVVSDRLAAQGAGLVPEIVAQLKAKYPAAQDAEIANYLVTAYCPVVNRDASLSDGEKADRLSALASAVMQSLAKP